MYSVATKIITLYSDHWIELPPFWTRNCTYRTYYDLYNIKAITKVTCHLVIKKWYNVGDQSAFSYILGVNDKEIVIADYPQTTVIDKDITTWFTSVVLEGTNEFHFCITHAYAMPYYRGAQVEVQLIIEYDEAKGELYVSESPVNQTNRQLSNIANVLWSFFYNFVIPLLPMIIPLIILLVLLHPIIFRIFKY